MNDDSTLPHGLFEGIDIASRVGVETFEEIAVDFMRDIFGYEPGEYLITDLSTLRSFVGFDDMEFVDLLARIRDVYGLDVADLPNATLLEIFRRLHARGVYSHSTR